MYYGLLMWLWLVWLNCWSEDWSRSAPGRCAGTGRSGGTDRWGWWVGSVGNSGLIGGPGLKQGVVMYLSWPRTGTGLEHGVVLYLSWSRTGARSGLLSVLVEDCNRTGARSDARDDTKLIFTKRVRRSWDQFSIVEWWIRREFSQSNERRFWWFRRKYKYTDTPDSRFQFGTVAIPRWD